MNDDIKEYTHIKCEKCDGVGIIIGDNGLTDGNREITRISCPECRGKGYTDWLEQTTGEIKPLVIEVFPDSSIDDHGNPTTTGSIQEAINKAVFHEGTVIVKPGEYNVKSCIDLMKVIPNSKTKLILIGCNFYFRPVRSIEKIDLNFVL